MCLPLIKSSQILDIGYGGLVHLTAITQVQNLSSDFIAAKGVHVVRVHKGDPVPVSVPLTVPGRYW